MTKTSREAMAIFEKRAAAIGTCFRKLDSLVALEWNVAVTRQWGLEASGCFDALSSPQSRKLSDLASKYSD